MADVRDVVKGIRSAQDAAREAADQVEKDRQDRLRRLQSGQEPTTEAGQIRR